jgi:hypothetical protein
VLASLSVSFKIDVVLVCETESKSTNSNKLSETKREIRTIQNEENWVKYINKCGTGRCTYAYFIPFCLVSQPVLPSGVHCLLDSLYSLS